MFEMGCYEISLGDTIGVGTPELTRKLFDAICVPRDRIAAHFHNTYDRAVPNLVVALGEGSCSVIDSSVAGIGGCPYADGASGNVATEDVIYLCELLGIEHGVDLPKLLEIGDFISHELGRKNQSCVSLADIDLIEERRAQLSALLVDLKSD